MLETVTENVNKIAFSVEEVSELTSLSKDFLRKEIRIGHLPIKRCGRRVIILKNDLHAYLNGEIKTGEVKNDK
jgi:excisionase family DNA binding protein